MVTGLRPQGPQGPQGDFATARSEQRASPMAQW